MTRQVIVGIDIGTSETRVVVGESSINQGHLVPKIISVGSSESRGIYRGYIANKLEAAKSVELALKRAEKAANLKLKRAYISFGGMGLSSITANGSVIISRADLEITERDLGLVLDAAEATIPKNNLMNKRIINTIPVEYKIDGKVVWGDPLGLKAQKLEVKALFITCLDHHLSDLISTVEEAGVEVIDVVASPVALSFVTLSKKQKRVGCLLADIGAETLSIVVFENNNLISLAVFPIGGNDITNDIALGLKVSLENAENIKIYGDKRITPSKKKLEEIIGARLSDCFELIQTHLKSIGRDGLLPAGIILGGSGAKISSIKSVAEHTLKLPAQVAEIHIGTTVEEKIKDTSWGVACGLLLVGLNSDEEQRSIGIRNGTLITEGGKRWMRTFSRWVSQFLP